MTTKYNIRYLADLNPSTGYNVACRGMLRALETIGYTPETLRLCPAIAAAPEAATTEENDWLWDYMRGRAEGDKINIVHLHPTKLPKLWTNYDGRYNIAVTAWETDKLPEMKVLNSNIPESLTVVEALNKRYDEVWVPTQLVKDVFVASGVDEGKIYVIPHAILPEITPGRKTCAIADRNVLADEHQGEETNVRFYAIGSWNDRKNMETVIRAYLSTGWDGSCPVELVIHCVPPSSNRLDIEQNSLLGETYLKRLRDTFTDAERLMLPGLLPHFLPKKYDWVAELHRNCHVLVTASRGEGFCLPVLEALACGNYVVGSDRVLKPFADYADFEYADGEVGPLVSVECEERGIAVMPEAEGYETDQKWWDVTVESMKQGFLDAYNQVKTHGMPDRMDVASRAESYYAPAQIGELIAQRLEEINAVLDRSGW